MDACNEKALLSYLPADKITSAFDPSRAVGLSGDIATLTAS
jgi:hypothetical protein